MLSSFEIKSDYLISGSEANNVCGDYEKFRQLMLLEEIKQCIHPDIQLFLDDQEIGDIYGADEKADYY